MSKLPALSARKLVAGLKRIGYVEARQAGSHLILKHPDRQILVIPMHVGDLAKPFLKSILKEAGISEEEFLRYL